MVDWLLIFLLTVDSDAHQIAYFFDLATGQANWSQVPQDQVVVGSASLKFVAVLN